MSVEEAVGAPTFEPKPTLEEYKERRARWVAALRSGDYEQGQFSLCSKNRYCCLGVACEVYQKDVGDLFIGGTPQFKIYGKSGVVLDEKVRRYYGLETIHGQYGDTVNRTLTSINDYDGLGFPQIADLIESTPSLFTWGNDVESTA